MRLVSISLLLLALLAVATAGWAATLFWWGIDNIIGGWKQIAANCPDNSNGCAAGGTQTALGGIAFIAGVAGAAFGQWKRDVDGEVVFHLYATPKYASRAIRRDPTALRDKLMTEYNATNPARYMLHQLDGTQIQGLYHFDPVTRVHHTWGDLRLETRLGRREVVGGNDGFAAAIQDDDTRTWANVARGQGDINEWASLTDDQLSNNDADSICIGFTDPDNNENVAMVRLQPATNGDYQNLNLDACQGHGYRKRSDRASEKRGIICQQVCTIVSGGNKQQCLDQGGGCSYVSGGCNPNLDQPASACDGIICGEQRQCD